MTQDNGASADADRAVAADAAEPEVSALRASIPSAMWAADDGGVIAYMDTVDFECELGAASGGNRIYPSPDDLKRHSQCWQRCGITEVKVFAVREVHPQNLWDDEDEDALAQAIEARRAETQSGSVHESAVGNADAPEPNGHTGEPT